MKIQIILMAFVMSFSTQAYDRIISLGGTLTEIVYALGEGEKVVGVDVSSVYPEEVNKVKKLGYRQNISLEGILSLKPDLILASSKMVPETLIDQLKKLKLNVQVITEEDSFESAKNKISQVALLIDKKDQGQKLISSLENDLSKVEEKISSLSFPKEDKAKRVLFIYARGGNRVFMSGTDTPAHKMIKLSGAKNAFAHVKGFKPITTESLILSNPDAIVMLGSGATSLKEGAWAIKGIDQTKAGKNKKLILVDDSAFLGFGPRSGKTLLNFTTEVEKL